jgi:hypothetical protein
MVAISSCNNYKKQKSIVMKKLKAFCAAFLLFLGASAASNVPGSGDELLTLLSSSSSKAVSEAEVEDAVIASFNRQFKDASQVSWSKTAEFYFARFSVEEAAYNTAFTEKGEYLAISRQIPFSQMPIATSQTLTRKYSDANLPSVVTEVCLEGQTDYYLKTENKTHVLLLKCSPDGRVTVFNKTKKKVLVGSVY